MLFDQILTLDRIELGFEPACKRQLFERLAERCAEKLNLPAEKILDLLLEREKLGSTGIGKGVAIPHGKLAELKDVFCLFARLDKPIDYDAPDEKPVDIIFMLLAHEGAGVNHLKVLSRIARLSNAAGALELIREAQTTTQVYDILIKLGQQETSSAA